MIFLHSLVHSLLREKERGGERQLVVSLSLLRERGERRSEIALCLPVQDGNFEVRRAPVLIKLKCEVETEIPERNWGWEEEGQSFWWETPLLLRAAGYLSPTEHISCPRYCDTTLPVLEGAFLRSPLITFPCPDWAFRSLLFCNLLSNSFAKWHNKCDHYLNED